MKRREPEWRITVPTWVAALVVAVVLWFAVYGLVVMIQEGP